MCVIRVRIENNFVVIKKEVLEDVLLSLSAKGLYCFCMTKPNDWTFSSESLMKALNIGKTVLYRCINELIDRSLCFRKQKRSGNGIWESYDYEIYGDYQLKKCLPQSGFQHAVDSIDKNGLKKCLPRSGNPPAAHIKTKYYKKTTTSPSPSSKPIDPKPRTTAAAFSVEEELKRSQLSKEEEVRALKFYETVKSTQDWSKVGNRVGWVIHMIRVGKDLEVSKNHDLVEKRKAWAEKNQWDSPAGYMRVVKDGIALVTGSIEKLIKWEMPDAFWVARGLA